MRESYTLFCYVCGQQEVTQCILKLHLTPFDFLRMGKMESSWVWEMWYGWGEGQRDQNVILLRFLGFFTFSLCEEYDMAKRFSCPILHLLAASLLCVHPFWANSVYHMYSSQSFDTILHWWGRNNHLQFASVVHLSTFHENQVSQSINQLSSRVHVCAQTEHIRSQSELK